MFMSLQGIEEKVAKSMQKKTTKHQKKLTYQDAVSSLMTAKAAEFFEFCKHALISLLYCITSGKKQTLWNKKPL